MAFFYEDNPDDKLYPFEGGEELIRSRKAGYLTYEEAKEVAKMIRMYGPSFGFTEYERNLLTRAEDIVKEGYRDSIRVELNKRDASVVNEEWDFINGMDVESHKDVGKAQEILKKYGYYQGDIDTFYGPQTKAAREQFKHDALGNKFIKQRVIDYAKGVFDIFGGD